MFGRLLSKLPLHRSVIMIVLLLILSGTAGMYTIQKWFPTKTADSLSAVAQILNESSPTAQVNPNQTPVGALKTVSLTPSASPAIGGTNTTNTLSPSPSGTSNSASPNPTPQISPSPVVSPPPPSPTPVVSPTPTPDTSPGFTVSPSSLNMTFGGRQRLENAFTVSYAGADSFTLSYWMWSGGFVFSPTQSALNPGQSVNVALETYGVQPGVYNGTATFSNPVNGAQIAASIHITIQ